MLQKNFEVWFKKDGINFNTSDIGKIGFCRAGT